RSARPRGARSLPGRRGKPLLEREEWLERLERLERSPLPALVPAVAPPEQERPAPEAALAPSCSTPTARRPRLRPERPACAPTRANPSIPCVSEDSDCAAAADRCRVSEPHEFSSLLVSL